MDGGSECREDMKGVRRYGDCGRGGEGEGEGWRGGVEDDDEGGGREEGGERSSWRWMREDEEGMWRSICITARRLHVAAGAGRKIKVVTDTHYRG